jgi:hypothetical protein
LDLSIEPSTQVSTGSEICGTAPDAAVTGADDAELVGRRHLPIWKGVGHLLLLRLGHERAHLKTEFA